MSRVDGLWPLLTSPAHLLDSARAAARGKRTRPAVAEFLFNLEGEIFRLRDELIGGGYQPGPYREFVVTDPKRRLIRAAPFRDRVVHHALTRVLEPVFERRFLPHSTACRRGLGTHAALARAREACRHYRFALKCDVVRYFASMDHGVLIERLSQVVRCPRTLDLAARIIASSCDDDEHGGCFPGDDLFTPFERRRGLPLGNQTSQFFANVYLNPLDHFVVRQVKPSAYVRYVDDFLVFSNDRQILSSCRDRISTFLEGLRLRLHPRKSRVYRTTDGITFLGWRLFPDRTRLVRSNVVRFRRRLRLLAEEHAAGRRTLPEVRQHVAAWIGHAAWGATIQLRREVLSEVVFRHRSGV